MLKYNESATVEDTAKSVIITNTKEVKPIFGDWKQQIPFYIGMCTAINMSKVAEP